MDASHNQIEMVEGVIEFWSELKSIKLLRYHGNPGVRHVEHYRKRLVNALPLLTYMDERPVFPVERKSCKAWEEGGLSAMHEARKEYNRQQQAVCGVDPERRELITKRRQMAIERMDREAKEREEREQQKHVEDPDAMLGKGCKAEDGNLEALAEYEESWQKQINRFGIEGVRAKVAREEGKQHSYAKPQVDQHKAMAELAFTPPARVTEEQTDPAIANRRQPKLVPTVADFRVSASDEYDDVADRQFTVFGDLDGAELYKANKSHNTSTQGGGLSKEREEGNGIIIPACWEHSMDETAAAEAACFEQQERVTRAIAEDRNRLLGGEFGGLD